MLYSDYMDVFLTGGWDSFYMVAIRLDITSHQGSYKWTEIETGEEETGPLLLVDCKNVNVPQ
ncbi:MAG: hypothetical protein ACUVS3_17080 [Thermodesulfobacteriota bacterium]